MFIPKGNFNSVVYRYGKTVGKGKKSLKDFFTDRWHRLFTQGHSHAFDK